MEIIIIIYYTSISYKMHSKLRSIIYHTLVIISEYDSYND